MAAFCQRAIRKKGVADVPLDKGSLHRCLTTFDLTLMGVGAMVGSGIYIMTGVAAKDLAGPSIVLSFVIAAVVVALAAACFTEFATQFHRAGSTYLYMYLSLGELPAFIMGWCLTISFIFGGASTARAWSAYLDNLLDGAVANFTETHIGKWTVGAPISTYPDFMAAGMVLIITIIISVGARCSSTINAIFALLNIVLLLFVTIVGFVFADIRNWTSEQTGGFMPFGFSGVLAGSGACFWSLTGFEVLSAAVEEAKTPKRSIPLGTAIAIVGVTALYIGTSAAITLMTSYQDIDSSAPLPSAFEVRGVIWAQYISALGPLLGLTTMSLNSVFSCVRLIYAMAEDGLLPGVFSFIYKRTQIPIVTSLTSGVLMSLTALFMNLDDILGFAVVISLSQYIGIAVAVIILRYQFHKKATFSRKVSYYKSTTSGSVPTEREASLGEAEHTETSSAINWDSANVSTTRGSVQDYHPSMDNTGMDQPEDDSDSHDFEEIYISHHGHFLPEDCEGEGFTTCDDETTLFDVRKFKQQKVEPCNDAQNKTRANILNDPANDVKFIDESGNVNIETAPMDSTGGSTESSSLFTSYAGVVDLKTRFDCLRPFFRPCRGYWVTTATFLVFVLSMLLSVTGFYASEKLETGCWWAILLLCVLVVILLTVVGSIWIHQQSPNKATFQVPCVPLLPSLTILTSALLLVSNATPISWIGFAIIIILAFVVYFVYGIHHSKLNSSSFGKDRTSVADGNGSDGGDSVGLLHQEETEDEI